MEMLGKGWFSPKAIEMRLVGNPNCFSQAKITCLLHGICYRIKSQPKEAEPGFEGTAERDKAGLGVQSPNSAQLHFLDECLTSSHTVFDSSADANFLPCFYF